MRLTVAVNVGFLNTSTWKFPQAFSINSLFFVETILILYDPSAASFERSKSRERDQNSFVLTVVRFTSLPVGSFMITSNGVLLGTVRDFPFCRTIE